MDWPSFQTKAVDIIKSAGFGLLHETEKGEALLMSIYLFFEENAESLFFSSLINEDLPEWLNKQLQEQSKDETAHAILFSKRILELGIVRKPTVDFLGKFKISRLQKLVHQKKYQFHEGCKLGLLAVVYRLEIMCARVMQRHIRILKTGHPTRILLENVLNDEKRHIEACRLALERLAVSDEKTKLKNLYAEIDAIDRSWSVSQAVALYLAGLYFVMEKKIFNIPFRLGGGPHESIDIPCTRNK